MPFWNHSRSGPAAQTAWPPTWVVPLSRQAAPPRSSKLLGRPRRVRLGQPAGAGRGAWPCAVFAAAGGPPSWRLQGEGVLVRLQGCNQLDQQAVLLQRSCDLQGSRAGGQPNASLSARASEAGSCRAISTDGAEASWQDSAIQLHCAGCTLLVRNDMTAASACRWAHCHALCPAFKQPAALHQTCDAGGHLSIIESHRPMQQHSASAVCEVSD